MAVDVKWVERRRAGEALRGNRLNDIATGDVSFEGVDVFFVAGLADIGGVLLIWTYWGLGWERNVRGEENGNGGQKCMGGRVVCCRNFRGVIGGRDMEVGNDFYELVEVVEGDDGVEKHKQGFRNLENILHRPSCSWFKVSNTIVAYIADSAACQGRENQAWYGSFSIL